MRGRVISAGSIERAKLIKVNTHPLLHLVSHALGIVGGVIRALLTREEVHAYEVAALGIEDLQTGEWQPILKLSSHTERDRITAELRRHPWSS